MVLSSVVMENSPSQLGCRADRLCGPGRRAAAPQRRGHGCACRPSSYRHLGIFFALNLWYSGSETILQDEATGSCNGPAPFDFSRHLWWVAPDADAVFWYVLNWTALGRHIYDRR
jgi:hypothetical protein